MYMYDFSLDYDSVDLDDILDIHKCLMKKYNMKKCLDSFNKMFIGLLTAHATAKFVNINSNEPLY